jgi:hypothetical protein
MPIPSPCGAYSVPLDPYRQLGFSVKESSSAGFHEKKGATIPEPSARLAIQRQPELKSEANMEVQLTLTAP